MCRSIMKPCVVDVTNIQMNLDRNLCFTTGEIVKSGDIVTVDGTKGLFILGESLVSTVHKKDPNFLLLLKWADKYRRLKVFSSVGGYGLYDNMQHAEDNNTDGYGCIDTDCWLCCTGDRLSLSRLLIIEDLPMAKLLHMDTLKNLLKSDFKRVFLLSKDKPVCIKLFDRSLHHLLPEGNISNAIEIATFMNRALSDVKDSMCRIHDSNPAFGLRGCRLTALTEMFTVIQVTALTEALMDICDFMDQNQSLKVIKARTRVAIPMITSDSEFDMVAAIIMSTAKKVIEIIII